MVFRPDTQSVPAKYKIQLLKLEAELPPALPREAILTPEYFMSPFIERRSHVAIPFFVGKDATIQTEILASCRFVLIPKLPEYSNYRSYFSRIPGMKEKFETADFIMFQRGSPE